MTNFRILLILSHVCEYIYNIIYIYIFISYDSNCSTTMKNHKNNFESKPSVRLTDPAINEIRYVSKVTLDKINVAIKSQ